MIMIKITRLIAMKNIQLIIIVGPNGPQDCKAGTVQTAAGLLISGSEQPHQWALTASSVGPNSLISGP